MHTNEHAARPISGPSVCGTYVTHFTTFGTVLAVEVAPLRLDPLPALYTVYIRLTFRLEYVL